MALWLVSVPGDPPPENQVVYEPIVTDTTGNDTLQKAGSGASIRWRDFYRNRLTEPRPVSPLYLPDPENIRTTIQLDSMGSVNVNEDIQTQDGSIRYRFGERLDRSTFDEIQQKRAMQSLIREYSIRQSEQLGGRGLLPKLDLPPVLDRLFGNGEIDFKPNGFVALDLGVMHQFIDNPSIPVRQRRNTNFIFNEQININFNANLGENVKFLTNFDTKSSFNLDQLLKLNYKAPEESALKAVQLGNINWTINSQLIPGAQNLFGARTDFQFGRLSASMVMSQQRSNKERIVLKGGNYGKDFELRVDHYDENRHFFLSQHFRDKYESSLKNLPMITSGATITRLEVYVTNRTASTGSMRNIVGFMDLGEPKPYRSANPAFQPIQANEPTGNTTNGLYTKLIQSETFRQVDQTNQDLASRYNLEKGVDYELLRGAKRLLNDKEYKFNKDLGYISLITPLRNDEVLSVAYEYTSNGRTYKVGELTEDYQNRRDDEVIVLKMLKSSTIRNNTKLPMWDLMMKNVYSLGTAQIQKQGFQMRVIYKDDLTGIDNPNLQESSLQNQPLIRVLGLDRLNPANDIQPDGNFDFVEGITIDTQTGRIFFPTLEPFGKSLAEKFNASEAQFRDKYVFDELYRRTMIDAQQMNEKNKFYLKGSYQSAGGQEIELPYGVLEESVTVTSGGVALSRGSDFMVEPQAGRLRILNQSVMNSGREIVVEYERPDMFLNQIRSLFGTRLDYILNRNINLGFTAMHYRESTAGRLTRVAIGNEPARNSILGMDISYNKEAPGLTNLLDKLPLIQTKEMSNIQFKGEVARLMPGVANIVGNRSLIDDFEAARTIYDMTRQPNRWRLGSTPTGYSQSSSTEPLGYAYKRAKIVAYTVDNIFSMNQLGGATVQRPDLPDSELNNFYQKVFYPNDIFSGKSVPLLNLPQTILDIAYFPSERGMYNYTTNLDRNGRLRSPKENFGAVTRMITSDNDFDNANIENIEFWMLNPFITDPERGVVKDGFENRVNTTGGKLVFNLGDISEDVIPDERYNFENGMPTGELIKGVNYDSTAWGRVTRQQFVINAFTNEEGARAKQDIGLDGLNNQDEANHFKNVYLDRLPANLTPEARENLLQDPSGDDFKFYLDTDFPSTASILERYKSFMGMEGNSPESNQNTANYTQSSSNLPDGEDLNTDNTINDNEAYFEYDIDLKPGGLDIGKGYIVDKTSTEGEEWYLFRVPIKEFTRKVGSIDGFKSIRFVRMYLTGFEQPVVLRFAQLQMVAQQYRKYTLDLDAPGLQEVPEPYDAKFTLGTVSIEENSQSGSNQVNKFIYSVPPGWVRDIDYTQTQTNFQMNEQAMSLCVTNLRNGDSRAAYKNVNLDLLFRKRLRMYIHMHNENNIPVKAAAFLRLGTDVTQNYYEIEINDLQPTPPNQAQQDIVWPAQNELNIAFEDLINAKSARNRSNSALSAPFSVMTADGRYKVTVVGNPDLSEVRVLMIGARNPKTDDERASTFCLWVNELHVEGFDQTAGSAAIAQLNMKLADVATIMASARVQTFGFGGVQTKIGERSQSTTTEFGIASNIALDKFFPQQWGLSIPMYLNYDIRRETPHFNPLDPDTPLETSLDNLISAEERNRYRRMVEDNTVRRGINLTNVRKNRMGNNTKTHFYDIENFAFTYAFSDLNRTNILTETYAQRLFKGGIAYAYAKQRTPWEPFKKWNTSSRYGEFVKAFNLSLLPSSVGVRADLDRSFTKTHLRNSDLTTDGMEPFYEKYFWFNRYYDLNWNLSRSLILSYNSFANAIIDEPYGDINTETKQDSLWKNIKSLGRMKVFDQKIRMTYRLPLDKIPFTDWMTADYSHTIGYNYQANAFGITDNEGLPFGDIIRNSRDRGISGRVDFVALYNKLKYLRFANSPNAPRKNFTRSPGDIEDIERSQSQVLKSAARILMTVRGINVTYNVLETTALPGFLRAPKYFGLDNMGAPGLPFVLGQQDRNFQIKAAENGWVTTSRESNQPFEQTIQKRFTMNTSLEPFRNFRMQINAEYTRQDAYQEFFKPMEAGGDFISQNPLRNGQFSMSFLSFRTAFAKMPRDNSSETFDKFRDYREIMKNRLNLENINGGEYNENSQDVLIPAFFAAYSGKDPATVNISPFLKFPMPNWRIEYSGLSQLEGFKKLFSAFTVNHDYKSTYSVGNFTSSLGYEALFVNLAVMGYPLSGRLNDFGQYVPVFAMSTITMQEKFYPVAGVNFRTQSRITGRVDYNRDRTVALNLSNSQVAELFNQDLTVNIGFTKNNVPIPFKINGVKKRLKNDLTMQLGLTFRDTRSIQRKLDGEIIPIAGNINFQLKPTVNYVVNNRLSMMLYFDKTFNDPLVSNSFYRSTAAGGVQLKFNLAD